MPILKLGGMTFEWHDTKFELVKNQREIEFEEVCSVFFDDNALTFEDDGHYDEQRFVTVGMSNQFRLLTVVWVERDEFISRIITAFTPSLTQKRSYESYAK